MLCYISYRAMKDQMMWMCRFGTTAFRQAAVIMSQLQNLQLAGLRVVINNNISYNKLVVKRYICGSYVCRTKQWLLLV